MAEHRQGGDTDARWRERFEQRYASHIEALKQRKAEDERRARKLECEQNYREAYGEEPPGYYCGV